MYHFGARLVLGNFSNFVPIVMQSEVDYILAELIKQLVPHHAQKELERVSKMTALSKSTLRMAQKRKSINADTLIKLFLAHGVSPEVLLNLPRKNISQVSEVS